MSKADVGLLILIVISNLLWLNDACSKYDKIDRLDTVLSRLLHNLGYRRTGGLHDDEVH